MDAEKADYEITRMTRLLGVSRSGYYAWAARRAAGPGPQATRRAQVDEAVRAAHERSDRVDGAPRITAALARDGLVVDQKTVAASMRRQGLEGISPRKWAPVTTIPGTATHSISDLVEGAFDTGSLDAVWISDITYLRTA